MPGSSSQRTNSSAIWPISSGSSSSTPCNRLLESTSINWASSVQGEYGRGAIISFSPYCSLTSSKVRCSTGNPRTSPQSLQKR